MQYRIKTMNAIHKSGLHVLPKEQFSVSEDSTDPDVILCRSASLHEMKFPSSLKAIARAGAGVNNIPIERCNARGIVVFNTLGANANAVKELVFAAMIVAFRNLMQGSVWLQSLGSATDIDALIEQKKKQYSGVELQNKVLGVIGLGSIGHKVANLGVSCNMEVVGYDPHLSVENALQLSREVTIINKAEELLSRADVITIHVNYSTNTHHLLNKELLSHCKPGALLLNFARKDVVDEHAVMSLLDKNVFGQYVTDFPSAQLIAHPKVMCFPHLGASTQESEENCSKIAATAIKNFLCYGTIHGSVNYPNCTLRPHPDSKYRLLVGNHNVANVVASITRLLGRNDINIEDMVNTHKEDIAYNIIDIDKEITENILQQIQSIESVIFVRCVSL